MKKINNGLSLPVPGVKSDSFSMSIPDIKRGRIDIDKIEALKASSPLLHFF